MDYKQKIQKLLSLAESTNEHEAKAALLKARQLMAEHKLSEKEVLELQSREVKKVETDITFTTRSNVWIGFLANVIGQNYCCKAFNGRYKRKQTRTIWFAGLEDDVELCITIYKYAVECIKKGQSEIFKKYDTLDKRVVKGIATEYARGYVDGIRKAFEKQQEENPQWGLILVTPAEVTEAMAALKNETLKCNVTCNDEAYQNGYKEGEKFDPKKRIEEKECSYAV